MSGSSVPARTEYDPFIEILLSQDRSDKDRVNVISQFRDYQYANRQQWYEPDLAGFASTLLDRGVAESSVKTYLSTVRGVYKGLLASNDVRDALYRMMPETTPESKFAILSEILARMQNAIHPSAVYVELPVMQDVEDSNALRLTRQQAERLLYAPDVTTLPGLRDVSMFSLALCTGVRVAELVSLQTDDLEQHLSGELALRIRHGKGNKQRLVPYGALDWSLALTRQWLAKAGITSGYVFRGVWKGGNTVRDTALTTFGFERILKGYPIVVHGKTREIKPHDLRRTYARLMYESGVELVAIQQNLGHTNVETTLSYIGALDAKRRVAPLILNYNLQQKGL